MKKLNLHNGIIAASAVLCSILLGACSADELVSRDENLHGDSDVICFGVMKVSSEGWPDTKSGGAAGDAQATRFVLRGENAGDSLCVKAEVCEFGESDGVATKGALAKAMHDNFGVTACFKSTGGASSSGYLFFNEQNNKPASGTTWTYDSGRIYYWPGSSFNLDFYAYSPYSNAGLTTPVDNGDGAVPSISYVVPASVSSQADLLSAVSTGNSGSTNAAVPLTFRHICTAVEFVEGDDMQPGSITSIKVKGVRNSGSYSFGQTYTDAVSAWTLGSTTADFEALASSYTTSQTSGTDIAGDSNCLIMLPQVLPDDASVEIVFKDDVTGKSRTLTASIAGQNWPQGKRVRYRISISPDYDLSFDEENVRQVDAHYLIQSLKIHVDPALTTGWTLESPDTNVVALRTDLTDLAKQGYWIDSEAGTKTISGTNSGDITVYAFFRENAGQSDRDVEFSLYPTGYASKATKSTISQVCPAWTDSYGAEKIEEDKEQEWGFSWTRVVKYHYKGFWAGLYYLLTSSYNNDYITVERNIVWYWLWNSTYDATIDYTKLNNLDDKAQSDDDGDTNTSDLYAFTGGTAINTLETTLDDWLGSSRKTVTGGSETITDYAALSAIKKNKFKKKITEREETDDKGETVKKTVIEPILISQDWYLPASNQYSVIDGLLSGSYQMSGTYWTSTACDNNTEAYTYTSGSGLSTDSRLTSHKLRACRQK